RGARRTVLSAGVLASPLILQRSGHRADALGRNVRMHPGAIVFGVFDDDVAPWSGATQGYHVTGFLDEGIACASGLAARPACATTSVRGMSAACRSASRAWSRWSSPPVRAASWLGSTGWHPDTTTSARRRPFAAQALRRTTF